MEAELPRRGRRQGQGDARGLGDRRQHVAARTGRACWSASARARRCRSATTCGACARCSASRSRAEEKFAVAPPTGISPYGGNEPARRPARPCSPSSATTRSAAPRAIPRTPSSKRVAMKDARSDEDARMPRRRWSLTAVATIRRADGRVARPAAAATRATGTARTGKAGGSRGATPSSDACRRSPPTTPRAMQRVASRRPEDAAISQAARHVRQARSSIEGYADANRDGDDRARARTTARTSCATS